MDSPAPTIVQNAGAGVSKALNTRTLVYVAIIFFVVIMMIKYFTKQEIVDNNGNVTGTIQQKVGLNKDKKE